MERTAPDSGDASVLCLSILSLESGRGHCWLVVSGPGEAVPLGVARGGRDWAGSLSPLALTLRIGVFLSLIGLAAVALAAPSPASAACRHKSCTVIGLPPKLGKYKLGEAGSQLHLEKLGKRYLFSGFRLRVRDSSSECSQYSGRLAVVPGHNVAVRWTKDTHFGDDEVQRFYYWKLSRAGGFHTSSGPGNVRARIGEKSYEANLWVHFQNLADATPEKIREYGGKFRASGGLDIRVAPETYCETRFDGPPQGKRSRR